MFWPPMDIDETQNIGAIPTAWTPPSVFDRCSSVANLSTSRSVDRSFRAGDRLTHTCVGLDVLHFQIIHHAEIAAAEGF
jgi:hypothetical protein